MPAARDECLLLARIPRDGRPHRRRGRHVVPVPEPSRSSPTSSAPSPLGCLAAAWLGIQGRTGAARRRNRRQAPKARATKNGTGPRTFGAGPVRQIDWRRQCANWCVVAASRGIGAVELLQERHVVLDVAEELGRQVVHEPVADDDALDGQIGQVVGHRVGWDQPALQARRSARS